MNNTRRRIACWKTWAHSWGVQMIVYQYAQHFNLYGSFRPVIV